MSMDCSRAKAPRGSPDTMLHAMTWRRSSSVALKGGPTAVPSAAVSCTSPKVTAGDAGPLITGASFTSMTPMTRVLLAESPPASWTVTRRL